MKPRYAGCAKHAMKYYAKHRQETPIFRSPAEKQDWEACDQAFLAMDSKAQELLLEVYQGRDTFGDNVFNTAKRWSIPQNDIWVIVNRFEKQYAQRRGLI